MKNLVFFYLISIILYISLEFPTLHGAPKIIEEFSESKGFLPISMTGLNPLDKIFYLSFDAALSMDYNKSSQALKTGNPYINIGIKHSLKNTWFLGFNVGSFNYNNSSKSGSYLNYVKISQEISYPFNLYYPVYTLVGIQMGYAFPVASQVKLFNIDKSRKNTLFFSGFMTFLYYYSTDYSFYLRIDMNHSIDTSDMNRLSVALGVMRALI